MRAYGFYGSGGGRYPTDREVAQAEALVGWEHVEIDRDQAILLGVTPQQIEDTLYSAYGPRTVSTIFAPNDLKLDAVSMPSTVERSAAMSPATRIPRTPTGNPTSCNLR
jgi:hypothetical protein